MAAPHVAGYAALVLSNNNGLRPDFVGDLVIRCATDGAILAPGAGSPNRLLFVSEVEPRECPGWLLIAAGTPALADGSGWADPANYSTIQALDVGGVLHLVARGDAGIFTYRLNCAHWEQVFLGQPQLSDGSGWADPTNYSTIQAVELGNELHLVARGDAGIFTYLLVQ